MANILVVDDREDKLLALDSILADLGENVVKAKSGREALRYLLRNDFAVILLDVNMPGLNGFETAKLIRSRARSESTPIIFVTSLSDSERNIAEGYALGAVDYMLTPIVPEILKTKVGVFVELYRKTAKVKEQAAQLQQIIVEQKSAQHEIHNLNQELEARVVDLSAMNKELETVTYSLAHDLRAPLRSMQSFAHMLLEDYSEKLDQQGREFARRITESSKRMDTLLEDILSYSLLTHTEFEHNSIDLEEIVAGVIDQLDRDVKEKNAEVNVEHPLDNVIAHRATMQQVLLNLIGNALKFVPAERTPSIRIWTQKRNSRVRISIQDNGIGIAQYQERIFGLFERLHSNDDYPGTGVGLAIVRKGVERMGGRFGLDSKEGTGSCFWLELPKAEGENC